MLGKDVLTRTWSGEAWMPMLLSSAACSAQQPGGHTSSHRSSYGAAALCAKQAVRAGATLTV